MKVLSLFFGFLFITLVGCKENLQHSEIDKEIQELKTLEAKRNYLENILVEDQAVRTENPNNISSVFGIDSKEYKDYVQKQMSQDSINLIKIESYFKAFGHPKKSELGDLAVAAPWAVIQHAKTYEDRDRNFEIIYAAYLNEDIRYSAMSMYLGRMYEIKNHERLQVETSLTFDEVINTYINALSLGDKKKNVQQDLENLRKKS